MARGDMHVPWAISRIRKLTRSQPRNLLSVAKLKRAKSLVFLASCRRTRMAQMSGRRRGALYPTNLPLLQGVGVQEISVKTFMVCSSIRWRSKNGSTHALHALRLTYSQGSTPSGHARKCSRRANFEYAA